MPTWILVADNSRARLFAAEKAADQTPEAIRKHLPDFL
ncbi:host attachment protein [Allochromatium tepidum]|uniref:Host attachment protein n=1 Tax=Allochromatium tepidum TaxID=553982 RepID=A0ABN6G8D9_9GAMM|nr:host attachment protein [Allochromatium tepidum]BCU05944.1 hypothetical protein Atep_06210 [Allochromatium tepidum]